MVTEPFSEWVISGTFAAGRPRWEDAGATFTADVVPFEDRKLWMLNGAHSMLAYAGSLRGHVTVADAMRDATCLAWLDQWWDAASQHLSLPTASNDAYRAALVERFDLDPTKSFQATIHGKPVIVSDYFDAVAAAKVVGR